MTSSDNLQQRRLLLVEDNPAHAELITRCLLEQGIVREIHHVTDGEQALDYLLQQGEFSDPSRSPRPDVVLLDIRLPRIGGLEVLERIRATDALITLPVIILTSSRAEVDILSSYRNQANSYLSKPMDFAAFEQLMLDLGRYWLLWNITPLTPPLSADAR